MISHLTKKILSKYKKYVSKVYNSKISETPCFNFDIELTDTETPLLRFLQNIFYYKSDCFLIKKSCNYDESKISKKEALIENLNNPYWQSANKSLLLSLYLNIQWFTLSSSILGFCYLLSSVKNEFNQNKITFWGWLFFVKKILLWIIYIASIPFFTLFLDSTTFLNEVGYIVFWFVCYPVFWCLISILSNVFLRMWILKVLKTKQNINH